MGRTVRQKRKNRSSRPKVKQTNKSKKQLNPLGNSIIARNWDKNETLTQNYRRLGLLTRLQAPTGGSEPTTLDAKTPAPPVAPLKIKTKAAAPGALREVRVERDASGKIVRVLRGAGDGGNPLNDPLNDLESDNSDFDGFSEDGWDAVADPDAALGDDGGEEGPTGRVVDQLERLARRPVVKEVRGQSQREVEWLERLVRRHGDDTAAMARDHRLNPMQQTAADLGRRIKRWKAASQS